MAAKMGRRRFQRGSSVACTSPAVRYLLAAYITQTLARGQREEFRMHLRGCATCAADVRRAKHIVQTGHHALESTSLAWGRHMRSRSRPENRRPC